MRPRLARLARMDRAELAWRGRAAARTAAQRIAVALRPPAWHRRALLDVLVDDPSIQKVRAALARDEWQEAHEQFVAHLFRRSSRFLIVPQEREIVAPRIASAFRPATADAANRADRVLRGEYDLLGYRSLTFASRDSRELRHPALPDWHFDPVYGRRAPRRFWADVPFLDPECGDHKIIWELNRHQHWLALGRGYWLTGDRRYRNRFENELASWLEANPPLLGVNWASMLELGLRSVSWIWALHFFVHAGASDDTTPWTVDLLLALDRQLTHIEQNLSYYFSPNTHLLGEALALYVAGIAVPELAASRRRADIGRRILVAELARQVAADGGHCERSTHYHRYTLDFYAMALAMARVASDSIAPVFERAVLRLASAARVLCDDSGRAPHLGDDDGGMLLPMAGRAADDWRDSLAIAAILTGQRQLQIGPPPEETHWFLSHGAFGAAWTAHCRQSANTAPWRSTALADTGYYVSRSASGEHLVIDGGPHGYMNAGHAHADALAMTLSIRGLPLLIDPGTACYTIDASTRDRFRSTALHNTLVLDGRPQSVPAGPFHWERTANATTHRWRTTDAFDYFDGSHDGYAPVTHRRRVFALHSDVVIVADHVDDPARGRHAAAAHWHVDPAWAVEASGRTVAFHSRHERVRLVSPQGFITTAVSDRETGLGWHSPAYGRIEAAATVTVGHQGPAPFWLVSIFDLNPMDPIRDAVFLPVWAEAGTIAHAVGLRIARRGSIDFVLFAEPAPGVRRAAWRAAELETDACALFCTFDGTGAATRLAVVDGSFVRGAGRRAIGVSLGQVTSVYIDESTIRNFTPCAASPAS